MPMATDSRNPHDENNWGDCLCLYWLSFLEKLTHCVTMGYRSFDMWAIQYFCLSVLYMRCWLGSQAFGV